MITQQTWAIVVLAMLLIALSLQGVAVGTSSWFTATCSGHAATLGLWEYCEKPISLDWSCMPIDTALNGTELPHWLWAAQLHECLGVGALTLTSLVLGAYILIPELIEPSVAIAFSMLAIASGLFIAGGVAVYASGRAFLMKNVRSDTCDELLTLTWDYSLQFSFTSCLVSLLAALLSFAISYLARPERFIINKRSRRKLQKTTKGVNLVQQDQGLKRAPPPPRSYDWFETDTESEDGNANVTSGSKRSGYSPTGFSLNL